MHLRKVKNRKTGRIYLSIVQSYRDKDSKKPKSITIKSLGYLDDLEKEYADPIAFFSNEIALMNEQKAADYSPINLSICKNERISTNSTNRKNFGYAALSKIYHELKIDEFLANRQLHAKKEYSANSVMKLLIFSRLLYRASKKKAYENRDIFFEKLDFSFVDIYRCLSFLNKHQEAFKLWLHEHIRTQYKRSTNLVYYWITNHCFEIGEPDDMRKRETSRKHHFSSIFQMGLFTDTNGIPISYKLFPANLTDKTALISVLRKTQQDYSLGRIIVVADESKTIADNILNILSDGNGYVLNCSVRDADKSFQDYVLNKKGYTDTGDGLKVKSRVYSREISITTVSGKKVKKFVDEKQVIFYSSKYALKAKQDRAAILAKAGDLINSLARNNESAFCGACKYVKNLVIDPGVGEIPENIRQVLTFDEEKQKLTESESLERYHQILTFDEEKLGKEEKFDGYYAIVTSEYKEASEKIIEIYKNIWKIEELFKVTKSDFENRTIKLSLREHIGAHLLICFVSLVIIRILEQRLKGKYSITAVIKSLSKACCSHVKENYYLFDFYNDVLEDIGKELNIDFGKKIMTFGDIKKIIGNTKKV